MTPSNANTSGLEVVAWAFKLASDDTWDVCLTDPRCDTSDFSAVEPLVTAASAQARIADLEARVEYLRGSRDGHAAHAHSEFEARVAAEARADRLARGLKDAEESARRYARCYEPSSDGRNTFLMLADHIQALQQEG